MFWLILAGIVLAVYLVVHYIRSLQRRFGQARSNRDWPAARVIVLGPAVLVFGAIMACAVWLVLGVAWNQTVMSGLYEGEGVFSSIILLSIVIVGFLAFMAPIIAFYMFPAAEPYGSHEYDPEVGGRVWRPNLTKRHTNIPLMQHEWSVYLGALYSGFVVGGSFLTWLIGS